MYEYLATLTAYVDGDTIHVAIDCGFGVTLRQTVRLYGVNAPEMSTPAGQVADKFTREWFSTHCPTGAFTLRTVKDRREKYGRYLGTVVAPDGRCLNDDLVSQGQAVPYLKEGRT